MSLRVKIGAAGLYGLMAVVTFGHSASNTQRWVDTHCATPAQRLQDSGRCYMPVTGIAAGAAVAWPLYWSWEAWS